MSDELKTKTTPTKPKAPAKPKPATLPSLDDYSWVTYLGGREVSERHTGLTWKPSETKLLVPELVNRVKNSSSFSIKPFGGLE